jgi:adenylate cyclase
MEQGVKNEWVEWHCGQPIDVGPAPVEHPWVADYTRWLTGPRARLLDSEKLFDGLCGRLTEAGVPIDRCVLLFKTLHPVYPGHNYFWTRERGTWLVPLSHDFDNSERMLVSPYQEALDRGTAVRFDVSHGTETRMPILNELAHEGYQELVCELIPFTFGQTPGITFATKAASGFTAEATALLRAAVPPMATPLEVRAQRLTLGAVLRTYLGAAPGSNVLDGVIQRNDVRRLTCAILLADLRGFTEKAERWPSDSLLAALSSYFELLDRAVRRFGGDIIKFMGDGVLAIFPVEEAGSSGVACQRALDAALTARMQLPSINAERRVRGEEPIDFGCGLHIGEVAYGNIGSMERLDFTVIGTAVNVASRIQDFCKTLAQPVLLTADIAAEVGTPLVSCGKHRIRGITTPVRLFAPADADAIGTGSLQSA